MASSVMVEKASFIKDTFISNGLTATNIKSEEMQELTVFREPGKRTSTFVLLTVSFDFRDSGWGIESAVGDGYPELAEDKVEIQYAKVSMSEIGLIDHSTYNLPREIDAIELKQRFSEAIGYCMKFISGNARDALEARSKRNKGYLVDPLLLDSDNKHLKSVLASRNEELKVVLSRYL